MAACGLNIPANGSVSPQQITALGATWVRIVATPEYDLTAYFTTLRTAGIRVLLVLARESGGDYRLYRDLYSTRVDAWQIGNEPDGEGESSWSMTPHEWASLGRSVRALMPTALIVGGGLVSGQPSWLTGVDISWADALSFHPYAKNAIRDDDLPDIFELLEDYKRFGKPLIISEWGWWSDVEHRAVAEVDHTTLWAAETSEIEAFFYFCHSDRMVTPFGLLRADDTWKDRAYAFRDAASSAIDTGWPLPVASPTPPPGSSFDPIRAQLDIIEAASAQIRALIGG